MKEVHIEKKDRYVHRHIKYASVSFTLLYHFSRLSDPFLIASCISENLGRSMMFPQDSLRYSSTGIIRKALGSFELEKVCFALAGSCIK